MSADWHRRAILAAAAAMRENATLLTALDSAIGDGDHGTNMTRGFDAAQGTVDEIAALDTGPALQKLGMTLVSQVGGASGPLYGSLFMAMGKTMADGEITSTRVVEALGEGIEMVKRRGKAHAGEKTMLDVLIPVHAALQEGLEAGAAAADLAARARVAAEGARDATQDMKATKGRAAYLGDRSVGHVDPGAQSAYLLIDAFAKVVEGAA
jgi:dihydroxyacetone kinase-like protein